MALCNVTGTLYLPNGQLGKSMTLRFRRADQSVKAEYLGAVVPHDVYTQSDKSGQVDFDILTGVYVMLVEGGYSVRALVPDAATADIADCIDAAAIPDQPPVWYQQALNARDEAVDAAADANALIAPNVAAAVDAKNVAVGAKVEAESARDAAFINADVYADIATGRTAVADGQQFQVVTGDEIIRYRRDSSSTQAEVARYPAGQTVVALDGALGQLAAILGQTYEEVDRLSAAQEGDVYTLRTLLEALSLIGQLADQINGGQVALRGGSLADPALRIGTAGIYSSAADTLSVAIAGVERLRVTASGITVYGTVTEA